MACSVYINEVLVKLERESLNIEKIIEERSTASFTVVDTPGTANYVRGMPIAIYDSTPDLIFAGFIDTPDRSRIAPSSGLLHEISCMDNHYLADKRLVVESYTDKTAKVIIEDIWAKYLDAEGVTLGTIETGPTVKKIILNYVKVSKAFDAIKELSGPYTWFIDELKRLYFIDRGTNVADWQLDGITHRAIKGSVYLSTGNPKYRNFQYIWGGTDTTVEQTEVFTGDGVTVAFTLGYPLAVSPANTTGSINITGRDPTLQTVGIKGLATGVDCYWNKGDATITFDEPPENAETVTVVYYGQFPLISAIINSSAIVARAAIEGGSGITEDIIREAWHETRDASRQSAQAKITQYCQDAEKFIYQTHESGLSPGQLQEITYSPFDFTAHEMLIESVLITAIGDLITYDISCITGPVMGGWTRFFGDLLTRQDQSIRVGGDLLLKLLVEPESLSLAEGTDLTEHATEHYHWGDADALWGFTTWG